MADPAISRLLAEVRADRAVLDHRTREVQGYAAPEVARSAPNNAALALALDRTYSALESILERVAVTLEGALPEGRDWHRTLVDNALLAISDVRPPILAAPSIMGVHRLRKFRHFLRHAYAVELDGPRLVSLARELELLLPHLNAELDTFEGFLERLAEQVATLGHT